MAKRLKTLNLCDASVERMKRYPGGQSAFARQAILGFDRRRAELIETQRELQHQEAMLELNRHNWALLMDALVEAYVSGWTVEGLLMDITNKTADEVEQTHADGYLLTHIRMALNHRATDGDGSLA